jgi:hypothetical protein
VPDHAPEVPHEQDRAQHGQNDSQDHVREQLRRQVPVGRLENDLPAEQHGHRPVAVVPAAVSERDHPRPGLGQDKGPVVVVGHAPGPAAAPGKEKHGPAVSGEVSGQNQPALRLGRVGARPRPDGAIVAAVVRRGGAGGGGTGGGGTGDGPVARGFGHGRPHPQRRPVAPVPAFPRNKNLAGGPYAQPDGTRKIATSTTMPPWLPWLPAPRMLPLPSSSSSSPPPMAPYDIASPNLSRVTSSFESPNP